MSFTSTVQDFVAFIKLSQPEPENPPLRNRHYVPLDRIKQFFSVDRRRIESMISDNNKLGGNASSTDFCGLSLGSSHTGGRRRQDMPGILLPSSFDLSFRTRETDPEEFLNSVLVFSILLKVGAGFWEGSRINKVTILADYRTRNPKFLPITIYARKCLQNRDIMLEEHRLIHTYQQPSSLLTEHLISGEYNLMSQWYKNLGIFCDDLADRPIPGFKTLNLTRAEILRSLRGWTLHQTLQERRLLGYLPGCDVGNASPKNRAIARDLNIRWGIFVGLLHIIVFAASVAQNINIIFQHAQLVLLRFIKSSKKSIRVKSMVTLLSILSHTSPVRAGPMDNSAKSGIYCTSTVDEMLQELYGVTVQLFIAPSAGTTASAGHILTASLASTTLTVFLFKIARGQPRFKHFLWTGIGVWVLMGMILANNGVDFVFRYLFFGVNFAMVLSVVYHRYTGTSNEREDELEEFVDEKSGMVERMNTSSGG